MCHLGSVLAVYWHVDIAQVLHYQHCGGILQVQFLMDKAIVRAATLSGDRRNVSAVTVHYEYSAS